MKFIKRIFGRDKEPKPSSVDDRGQNPSLTDSDSGSEELLLARNLKSFERYNSYKTDFLYEQLPHRKKIVFDLVPLLIHLEGRGLLDCADACLNSPYGIYGYEPRPQTREAFAEAFPGFSFPELRPRASINPNLPLKSLSLIGSMGSIAQNSKSDMDYWICFDSAKIPPEKMHYFEEKLRAIEDWATAFAGAEIHFFPLDSARVVQNDFGSVGSESSGTAQAKLLKEEFYRSMTLVSGMAPMWWAMPPAVDNKEYSRLAEIIRQSSRINSANLLDLGNVHGISLGEFYGAAIWQINKTIGSPFKSVLKMALLEKYMFHQGREGLLCDILKERLIKDEDNLHYLDPYVLMFERASEYLQETSRQEDLNLLRQSLYLKSGARLTLADYRRNNPDRKTLVMVHLVREWGWNHKVVEKLNNYHLWTFRDSHRFSQEINRFMIRTYKNVSQELTEQQQQIDLKISQRDLTVLGRKLFIFYSRRTNKVESIKSVIEAPPTLESVTLQPRTDQNGEKSWTAYRGLVSRDRVLSGEASPLILHRSHFLPAVLVWLVTNRLYSPETTVNLNMGTGSMSTYCTVPDLQNLLREMTAFFPTLKLSELNEEEMLDKPRIVRMFVAVNLNEPDRAAKIAETGICYQNNWGEIFFKGYVDSQDGLQVARDFVRKRFAFDPLGALANFKIFMPDRHFRRVLGPRLNKFFGFSVVS